MSRIEQRFWNRFAALMMAGEAAQNLALLQPMLVELRRKLDEIAQHVRAGERRIGYIGKQPVQRMAEFVEQCACVFEAQKTGFAWRGFHKIHHVDDDWQNFAIELLLVAKRAHPGAAVFRRPRKIIADEQADLTAARVAHRP